MQAIVAETTILFRGEWSSATTHHSPIYTTQEEIPLAENTPQVPAEAGGQSEIVLKDENANAAYSNFARVTATPEEVIVDFGLNPNPFLAGKQEVHVTQRLIMNFYTAKRLCSALMMTLQRHEATFGSIELDVRRRAQMPQGGGGPPTGIRPQ
jgi:hypothetical protein